jgi:hypothetical protein
MLNEVVLQKVADWRPTGEGRKTLSIPDEGSGWSVAITADQHDRLSSSLWEVVLSATAPAAERSLQDWAYQVAGQARGLLESLKVVEIDGLRNEAILRSDEPATQGDQVAYYEVFLQGNRRATFRRYHASRQGQPRREQVSFTLTHEVLARLIADLAGE